MLMRLLQCSMAVSPNLLPSLHMAILIGTLKLRQAEPKILPLFHADRQAQ
jgi:hypothetical protein